MPSCSRCPAWLKEEFQWKNLRLNYPDPKVFYCTPWTVSSASAAVCASAAHVALRVALALYAVSTFIAAAEHSTRRQETDDYPGRWWKLFVYVTWWSLAVVNSLMVTSAVLAAVFWREGREAMLAETALKSLKSSMKSLASGRGGDQEDGDHNRAAKAAAVSRLADHLAVAVWMPDQHSNDGQSKPNVRNDPGTSMADRTSEQKRSINASVSFLNSGVPTATDDTRAAPVSPSQLLKPNERKGHSEVDSGTSTSNETSEQKRRIKESVSFRNSGTAIDDTKAAPGSPSQAGHPAPEIIITKPPTSLKWYFKLVWVFSNIAHPTSVLVTLVYWTLLYKGPPLTYHNFNEHGSNLIMVAVDFAISARPYRLLHGYLVVALGVTWCIISYLYTLVIDDNIYSIIDWDQPGKAIAVCSGLMVGLVAIHLGVFVLNKAKRRCFKSFYRRSEATWKDVVTEK